MGVARAPHLPYLGDEGAGGQSGGDAAYQVGKLHLFNLSEKRFFVRE